MASIEIYQQAYQAAKARGDKAGMEAAHQAADALRGYSTVTTKNASGGYVQTKAPEYDTIVQGLMDGTYQPPVRPPQQPQDFYADYLKDIQRANQMAQQEAERAAQLRTQSAISANNAYIPLVNQQTDEQLRQAYILAQKAKVNAPQALSAMGIQGGAAETSLMGIDANYGNQRQAYEQSRGQALGQIQQNEQQIRATGNADLASLGSQYYQNLMSAQQQAAQQAQSQYNWQTQFDANQGQNEIDNAYRAQVLSLQNTPQVGAPSSYRPSGTPTTPTAPKTNTIDQAKVTQIINGLGGYLVSQGNNEGAVRNIQGMYDQGAITEAEYRYILEKFGFKV